MIIGDDLVAEMRYLRSLLEERHVDAPAKLLQVWCDSLDSNTNVEDTLQRISQSFPMSQYGGLNDAETLLLGRIVGSAIELLSNAEAIHNCT